MLKHPTPNPVRPQLPLPELGAAIEALIALYDAADGDADLELSGDEHDGTSGEDEFCVHSKDYGPGCPVSDPDSEHDGCEEERSQ